MTRARSNTVTETGVAFFSAGGHSHDGVNSSIIETSRYSIFDFKFGLVSSNSARINAQTSNERAFRDFIMRVVNQSVLQPAGVVLQDNVINSRNIIARSITSDEIAANTIKAVNIQAGTITGNLIQANTITAAEIAASTITATQIAANTITATQIAANTITATQIAANTITAGQIASNTITAIEIAANTITAAQIAANTITGNLIQANTITATQIAASTITGTQIAANTITATQIAANTITATQIAANTITATQIAANTITATQIQSNIIFGNNATFTGTINTNNLTATGTLTGTFQSATSGARTVITGQNITLQPGGTGATGNIQFNPGSTGVGQVRSQNALRLTANNNILSTINMSSTHTEFYNGLYTFYGSGSTSSVRAQFSNTATRITVGTQGLNSSNMFITTVATGATITRFTSSIRYKKDVEDLEYVYAKKILEMRPVWFRSLSPEDNPNHSGYGFIAEEVAEIEPRLVHWADRISTGFIIDDFGNEVETFEEGNFPDGVQYSTFVAHIVVLLKDLYSKIDDMQNVIETLSLNENNEEI
jgi:hypothetical protein